MRRRLAITLVLILSVVELFGQRHAKGDYEFGGYLLGSGLMRDAITLTSSLSDDYTPAALDSMRYLKGKTLYQLQQFPEAAEALGSVGSDSPLWAASTLFGSACLMEMGDTSEAKQRLEKFASTPEGDPYREVIALQREGVALLEGNIEEYHLWRQEVSDNFGFGEQQLLLDNVAANPPRNLKPWVAGVASAVVPGLGQIYAGNIGEGVASFLAVGACAALTATSWSRAESPLNWRTITYGTIGSLLYIGNIFGSVASVKIYYQNFETINHQAVMYSIHIPLRDIFD